MALDNADLDPFSDSQPPRLADDFSADQSAEDEIELTIHDLAVGPMSEAGYAPVTLRTTRGDIQTRYYPAEAATTAVLFLGDTSGLDSPLGGRLYPRLAGEFQEDGRSVLRVRYRRIGRFEECVLDTLAAVAFLEAQGVRRVAIVGHGFGGTVALRAAGESEDVSACVALAPTGRLDESPGELADRCSLLLFDDLNEPQPGSPDPADRWLSLEPAGATPVSPEAGPGDEDDPDIEIENRLAGELYDWLDSQFEA